MKKPPPASRAPVRRRTGQTRKASETASIVPAGALAGLGLALVFQAIVTVVYMVGTAMGGPSVFEDHAVNPVRTLALLVIYPLAGMLAALLLPRATGLAGKLVVANLMTLPFGIGISLMDEGIDKYGNNSWITSTLCTLFFGTVFGVKWWRSSR